MPSPPPAREGFRLTVCRIGRVLGVAVVHCQCGSTRVGPRASSSRRLPPPPPAKYRGQFLHYHPHRSRMPITWAAQRGGRPRTSPLLALARALHGVLHSFQPMPHSATGSSAYAMRLHPPAMRLVAPAQPPSELRRCIIEAAAADGRRRRETGGVGVSDVDADMDLDGAGADRGEGKDQRRVVRGASSRAAAVGGGMDARAAVTMVHRRTASASASSSNAHSSARACLRWLRCIHPSSHGASFKTSTCGGGWSALAPPGYAGSGQNVPRGTDVSFSPPAQPALPLAVSRPRRKRTRTRPRSRSRSSPEGTITCAEYGSAASCSASYSTSYVSFVRARGRVASEATLPRRPRRSAQAISAATKGDVDGRGDATVRERAILLRLPSISAIPTLGRLTSHADNEASSAHHIQPCCGTTKRAMTSRAPPRSRAQHAWASCAAGALKGRVSLRSETVETTDKEWRESTDWEGKTRPKRKRRARDNSGRTREGAAQREWSRKGAGRARPTKGRK
ncbi:hypothetical protein DFH09DRAFT_1460033 [Mycena vulgaris]|nr:hypothetical protein DFH09DRAFT_1460033 [Mycena vulgaris]